LRLRPRRSMLAAARCCAAEANMFLRGLKITLSTVLLLIAAVAVYGAGQARITVSVTDTHGNPLPDAVVTITSTEMTNFEKVVDVGKYGTCNILILDATHHYRLHVEAKGFQPQERPFKVGIGSTDEVFEFQLKTLQEAAAEGEVEIKQQPGYKELEEGKELFKAGDKEAALAKFEEAVVAMPDLLPALAGVASINYELDRYEEALAAAKECLAVSEDSVECLAIAANASQELGDAEAHAEYMARYQELNPEDPAILYNEAAVFLNKMDDEGARPLLERCLSVDPDFPECNFEYGMLLLRTGDMEGAKKHLQKYLEVAPDGPDAGTAQETLKYL
jgi:Tfp pilus assembly protein PilF